MNGDTTLRSIQYTNSNPNSLVSVQHYNFAPRIGLSYAVRSEDGDSRAATAYSMEPLKLPEAPSWRPTIRSRIKWSWTTSY
jgi:hypothetical protein